MFDSDIHPIVVAQMADIPAWLVLAAEVEPLFGPMVADPLFHAALERAIRREMAFCVREQDGPSGDPLLGGLLFSASHAPVYTIGWLAVTARARRVGLGRRLVEHALTLVVPPATVEVVTFVAEEAEGAAARQLYAALGFAPAELTTFPPRDAPRQVFRLQIPRAAG
jgi:GNAT superfamily N-acetyltransferase